MKHPPNCMKFFEKARKLSQQQTKIRHGKFTMNHLKIIQEMFGNI